jgi:four helix bundle protein
MAKYQRFEDLPVWQEAARLYNVVLDLLEEPGVPLTPGFRNQLDPAALSVSNNVAEGFERSTTNELLSFIAIARGSSGEVRSMMAVVKDRPKLRRYVAALQKIRGLAESCARQLTGWAGAVDRLSFEGRRRMHETVRQSRQVEQKARDFRLSFLRQLKPTHPLYHSSEARAARGESVDGLVLTSSIFHLPSGAKPTARDALGLGLSRRLGRRQALRQPLSPNDRSNL